MAPSELMVVRCWVVVMLSDQKKDLVDQRPDDESGWFAPKKPLRSLTTHRDTHLMLIRKRPWIPLLLLLWVLIGWLGLVEAIKGDGGGLNRHGNNGNRLGRGRHLTDDNKDKDNKDKDNSKKEAKKGDENDDKKGAKGAQKEAAAKAVKKQEVQQGGGDKDNNNNNKDKNATPEPVTASPSVAPTDSGKVVVVETPPTSAPSAATNQEANKTDPPANVFVDTEGEEICAKATNCQECLEQAKEVSAKDANSFCSWLNEACTKAEARTVAIDTMCSTVTVDTSQESTPPATKNDDDDTGGGGFPYGLLFLIVMVAGLYVGRERAIKAMNDFLARSRSGGGASSFGGGNNDMGSVFSGGTGSFGSSTKSSTYHQER